MLPGDVADSRIIAVMRRHTGTCVLCVEDRVDHELANVLVLEAVVDGRARTTGPYKPCHPQLRQML